MAVTAPARKPAATSSYQSPTGGHVYKKCTTRHLFTITFGEGRGNLVLASYRGGARIADKVDVGLFFYKDWAKTAGKSPVELIPGSDGSNGPDLFEENGHTTPPLVMLDWKDYDGPPPVAFDYAKWVVDRMLNHDETIQIGCMGGHGRTGTFAAYVLMGVNTKHGPKEAIDWVHDKYCSDAIEGKDQEASIWAYHDVLNGVDLSEGAEA